MNFKLLIIIVLSFGIFLSAETSQNGYMRVDIARPTNVSSHQEVAYSLSVSNLMADATLSNVSVSLYGQKQTFASASVAPTSVVPDANGVTLQWATLPVLAPGEHFALDLVLNTGDLGGLSNITTTTTVKAKAGNIHSAASLQFHRVSRLYRRWPSSL